jgi:uncharacterized protein YoxC
MLGTAASARLVQGMQDEITRLLDITKGLLDEQIRINKKIQLQQNQIDLLSSQVEIVQRLASAVDTIAQEVDRLSSLIKP